MKVRTFTILIAILALFVGGSAMAQLSKHAVTPGDELGGVRSWLQTGDVLYDQSATPAGNGAPDQAFEAQYLQYDSEGADDFEVTTAAGWDISGVNTDGISAGGSLSVTHRLYSDGGGLPGAVLCEYVENTNYTDTAGDISATFDSPCNVDAGTAWLTQQVRQDFLLVGQHFWEMSTAQTGAPAVWRNPNNGFGLGCFDWTPAATCGVGGGFPDFSFQIIGKERNGGTGVPAVGPFGVLVMVLALGGTSGYVISRRRRS